MDLPEEIISFHILPRLPVRSLLKFKCVSKSLNSLISSPSFADRQLTVSKERSNLLVCHLLHRDIRFFLANLKNGKLSAAYSPTLEEDINWLEVSESIDGLVSLYPRCPILFPREEHYSSFICNPSTRETLMLPSNYSHHLQFYGADIISYSFGYEPLRKEYKVFRVSLIDVGQQVKKLYFEIFTLGATSWRRIDADLSVASRETFQAKSVCVNGALHWHFKQWSFKTEEVLQILVFDLADEKFRSIHVPRAGSPNDDFRACIYNLNTTLPRFIQVSGCLACTNCEDLDLNRLNIWILEDYKNQDWISNSITFNDGWKRSGRPFPIGSIHTGEILLVPCSKQSDLTWLLYYDLKRKIFRRVENIELPRFTSKCSSDYRFITCYFESLVSLKEYIVDLDKVFKLSSILFG